MIRCVMFDLDATLLPMDQDAFLRSYMKKLCAFLAQYGFAPQAVAAAVMKGTGAMIYNDGRQTNEDAFWQVFSAEMKTDMRQYESALEHFYQTEFDTLKSVTYPSPKAAECIRTVKESGRLAILATNPVFPVVATRARMRWAGLNINDFAIVTTYDNSSYCKPNPAYFLDLARRLGLQPSECLMVGNDTSDDMAAREAGLSVFLLTECLINSRNEDISQYPHGNYDDLLAHLRALDAHDGV